MRKLFSRASACAMAVLLAALCHPGAIARGDTPQEESAVIVVESANAGDEGQDGSLDNQTALTADEEMDAYAAQHEGDLPDGRYVFVSKLGSDLALDVKGSSKDNGASIIIWTKTEKENQRWDVAAAGGGYVTITSASSGLALDVKGGSAKAGAAVIQWSAKADGSRNQLWVIEKESDGSFKITSALTNDSGKHLVLDVNGAKASAGATTCLWTDKEDLSANQHWTATIPLDLALDAEAAEHAEDLQDGCYLVASQLGSDLVLDVKNASKEAGASIIVWPAKPATNEGWVVSHDSQGYVTFTNSLSGKVLDVNGGSSKNGASIIQWGAKSSGARNQKWIVSRESDGFKITSALTGKRLVLDVSGAQAKNGAQVILWEDKGTDVDNQRWTFSEAPEQYAHAHAVADGTYSIATSLDSTLVLDVSGNSLNAGAAVVLWTSKKSINQIWQLSHDNQGYVTLCSSLSGLYLAVGENETTIQQNAAYQWVIEKASGSQYVIRSAAEGTVLGVGSDAPQAGDAVSLAARTGSSAQSWTISSASPVSSGKASGSTRIMGTSPTTQAQAVRYLKAIFSSNGWKLPSEWTSDGESLQTLVKYFWEEGEIEGVRGDVALAQSLLETGFFQFGGDVVPSQYNFAGIGTTGGGVKGASFKNARIGIRAQVQHLKAYASKASLVQDCVDPRFSLVTRGCAPTLHDLNGRWAVPGDNYGETIAKYMNAMAAY